MADNFRTALNRIRALERDHRSGAVEITDRAAGVLIDFVRASRRPAANQPRRWPRLQRGQLAALAEATLRAQPSMAPMLNLANQVACAAEQGVSGQQLLRALEDFRRALRRANRRIARQFAARLRRHAVVLTYSYSSTVVAALLAARGKLARVVCSESRPLLEGRRLAEQLARAGIPVVVVADAALPGRVQEADALVVGADAILPGRPAFGGAGEAGAYVNKVGTRTLQAAARAAGKLFYLLADTSKILPPGLARHYRIEEKPAAELWRGAPRGVRVENRYFERIPLSRSFGTSVVLLTERGPMTPASLHRWAGRQPVARRWRTAS